MANVRTNMRIALALCLLLTGCAEQRADWHGDTRFSTDERSAIEIGETWLAEQAHRSPATIAWDYEVTSEEPLAGTIRRGAGSSVDGAATGLCLNRSTIYLNPDDRDAMPGTLDGLAAHEFAHCELGFADDPQSNGIMHIISPKRWTVREEEQLAHM